MLKVHIISDSLGNTAKDIAKAALAQFDVKIENYELIRHPFVQSKQELSEIIQPLSSQQDIIIQTLINRQLACYAIELAKEKDIYLLDVLSNLLTCLETKLQQPAKNKPGIIRKIDDTYFNRIEAIEFTVNYDDGKNINGIKEADLILIGVSRTSKTPLSMYLANQNIKVMNIPIVPEIPVPTELFNVDPRRIIGLTTSIEKLNAIRDERLKSLGVQLHHTYADEARIFEELNYAEQLMKSLKCPIINVENKAIEETAEIILDMVKKSGLKIIHL